MQTNENNQSAKDLIPGYLKGELTPEETEMLCSWIKMDSSNKRYFDEYSEIWITAKASSKNPGYDYKKGFLKFKEQIEANDSVITESFPHNLFRTIIRYAAVFVIAASLSGFVFYFIGRDKTVLFHRSFNELVVPLGSHAQFSLSDGTTVTLNAGSRLKYDSRYGINNRTVELEGEGYFKVAKDPDKPFIVKTSCLSVRALGTVFNVKAYAEDKTVETTLIEGSVRIEGIKSKSDLHTHILKPNQKLTFYKETNTIVEESSAYGDKTDNEIQTLQTRRSIPSERIITETVDVKPIISWKENQWIFEKQSLSQIATELERKFDVEIHFESERLKSFRFTGTIVAEPIEQVLEVISLSAPIDYKLKGRIVTLSEDKNTEELNKKLYRQ